MKEKHHNYRFYSSRDNFRQPNGNIQRKIMGAVVVVVVCILTFYYDYTRSNALLKSTISFVKMLFENIENKQNEAFVGPLTSKLMKS